MLILPFLGLQNYPFFHRGYFSSHVKSPLLVWDMLKIKFQDWNVLNGWNLYFHWPLLDCTRTITKIWHKTFQRFRMDGFWGNLKTHWSSLDATDLLTLFYITLLALFIFAANRLFVGKFFYSSISFKCSELFRLHQFKTWG